MRGVVQSGGTNRNVVPLGAAQVTLFEARDGTPVVIGQAVTDKNGSFAIARTESAGIYYATADLGGGVVLMAIVGPVLLDDIVINELTTVAAVYCTAQFLDNGAIEGGPFGLRVAAGMSTNLVAVSTGGPSPVLSSSPNADETNALRSTLSLANLLASCVRVPQAACAILFDVTTPPGGVPPTDTIGAMLNIALDPANHVGAIYAQCKALEVYRPALERQPDSWTLAVKVNDSGSDEHLFGGPGNLVFDRKGLAWITNNVVQGTPDSTQWSIVLSPEGRPALDSNGNPMSPFTGGGLLGPGFGIDVDGQGRIWIGNFGWGHVNPSPRGSVSLFDAHAHALSPDGRGFQNAVYRVQGTVVDDAGNVWLASYGNNRVVVYPGGDSTSPIVYEGGHTFVPFDIAIAVDGTAWVTNSSAQASGIGHLQLADGALRLIGETQAGKSVKGIAIDSLGNIWIGSGGDDHVYAFASDGTLLGGFQGGGMDAPWGLCVDGDDNVWVANFGPLQIGSVLHGRLTHLAGANAATRPKGLNIGDPISPPTGYTLPSAGSQVLLHNGTPLYGPEGPPCFIPMMRTTGVNVDQAGNVWTCNNWKPDFDTDTLGNATNPGGDGMVLFIGLAKPRER